MPALAQVIVHKEHVVGIVVAEAELALVSGLRLGSGGTLNLYFLHSNISIFYV